MIRFTGWCAASAAAPQATARQGGIPRGTFSNGGMSRAGTGSRAESKRGRASGEGQRVKRVPVPQEEHLVSALTSLGVQPRAGSPHPPPAARTRASPRQSPRGSRAECKPGRAGGDWLPRRKEAWSRKRGRAAREAGACTPRKAPRVTHTSLGVQPRAGSPHLPPAYAPVPARGSPRMRTRASPRQSPYDIPAEILLYYRLPAACAACRGPTSREIP